MWIMLYCSPVWQMHSLCYSRKPLRWAPSSAGLLVTTAACDQHQHRRGQGRTGVCLRWLKFNSDCSSSPEGYRHLHLAHGTFGPLQHVWSSTRICLASKLQVLNSCVLAMLLYGCKTWSSSADWSHRLNTYHRTCLCYILSIHWSDFMSSGSVTPFSTTIKKQGAATGSCSPHGWQCPSKGGNNESLKVTGRLALPPRLFKSHRAPASGRPHIHCLR